MAKKRGRPSRRSDYWEHEFARQKSELWKIAEDEEFKHCMDKDSFRGIYYDPVKVISNYGRVWTLTTHSFMKPYRNRLRGYHRVDVTVAGKRHNPNKTMFVHGMVANYFCNKDAVKLYGEENVEAHHTKAFDRTIKIYERQPEDGKKFYINCWKYLEWTEKKTEHKKITKLQYGNVPDETEDAVLYRSAQEHHPLSELRTTVRIQEELTPERKEEMGLPEEAEYIVNKTESVKVVFDPSDPKPDNLVEPKSEVLRKSVGLEAQED